MAKYHRCGCRNSNSSRSCLNSIGGRYHCDSYPYYTGACPDVDGCYDDEDNGNDNRRGRRRRRDRSNGIFTACLPLAVAANGIIPLVNGVGCGCGDFAVNSGLISVEEAGTYLATYTVRVPEGAAVDSTITLNVNDAAQASAITLVGGEGPGCFTAQAIFDADERSTVALRSSDAINVTDPSAQPLFTLSLVQL